MANKSFQCPGKNLGVLVNGINEARFFLAFRVPDKDRIRSSLSNEGEPVLDYPDNMEHEVNRIYDEENATYKTAQDFRDEFFKAFGINPTGSCKDELEGIRNRVYGILQRHVCDCSSCRIAYSDYMTRESELQAQSLNEQHRNYTADEFVKGIDNMGLGLMRF
jgi:hypothetical protein